MQSIRQDLYCKFEEAFRADLQAEEVERLIKNMFTLNLVDDDGYGVIEVEYKKVRVLRTGGCLYYAQRDVLAAAETSRALPKEVYAKVGKGAVFGKGQTHPLKYITVDGLKILKARAKSNKSVKFINRLINSSNPPSKVQLKILSHLFKIPDMESRKSAFTDWLLLIKDN